mgnify:CR=1 FL=1
MPSAPNADPAKEIKMSAPHFAAFSRSESASSVPTIISVPFHSGGYVQELCWHFGQRERYHRIDGRWHLGHIQVRNSASDRTVES